MQKLSKKEKDLQPLIYGYPTPTSIPGNEGCGRQVIDGVLVIIPFKVPFTDFIDSDGDKRFCECTEDFAKWNGNEKRNEVRRKETESRCKIPAYLIEIDGVFVVDTDSPRANRQYLKICTHKDCNTCPFKFDKAHPDYQVDYERTGNPLSMDYTFTDDDGDKSEKEYEDKDTENPIDYVIRKEQEDALQKAILEMDTDYQEIFRLLMKGKSYSQIGLIIGKPKTTIQYKAEKLISILKEKMKTF